MLNTLFNDSLKAACHAQFLHSSETHSVPINCHGDNSVQIEVLKATAKLAEFLVLVK